MPFAVGSPPLPCRSPYGSGFQTTLPFLFFFFLGEVESTVESSEAKHAASVFL